MSSKIRMIVISIIVLVLAGSIWFFMKGMGRQGPKTETSATEPLVPDYSGITVERVFSTDLAPGKGATAQDGSRVAGKYQMWIYAPRNLGNKGRQLVGQGGAQSVEFTIGKGEVIRGLEQGIIGMKTGGRRALIIPIEMGYGAQGTQDVPPNAILLAEFELLKVD